MPLGNSMHDVAHVAEDGPASLPRFHLPQRSAPQTPLKAGAAAQSAEQSAGAPGNPQTAMLGLIIHAAVDGVALGRTQTWKIAVTEVVDLTSFFPFRS